MEKWSKKMSIIFVQTDCSEFPVSPQWTTALHPLCVDWGIVRCASIARIQICSKCTSHNRFNANRTIIIEVLCTIYSISHTQINAKQKHIKTSKMVVSIIMLLSRNMLSKYFVIAAKVSCCLFVGLPSFLFVYSNRRVLFQVEIR